LARQILIQAGEISATGTLNDSETALAIWSALPLSGVAKRWGQEVYFEIPLSLEQSVDAREEMAVGELAYWPPGSAFCIFFGETPASIEGEPRAYSACNPFGIIARDPDLLDAVAEGAPIRVSALGLGSASGDPR